MRAGFKHLACLALAVGCSSSWAQNATVPESISALGRLEPHHGIIRVASPSTPQATYGAVLAELHVEEGDRVEKGQLLAVSDTAAVMQAMVEEGEASLAHAVKEVEATRSQATAACVRADVAGREAERRTRPAWPAWQRTSSAPSSARRCPARCSISWSGREN